MALSCSWSPTLLTTTQSSSSSAASPSTPKLVPCHFPGKPTTTTIHTLSSCSSSSQKWRAKVSFFPAFLNKRKDTQPIKDELLDAIAPLDRGADATPEDQQTVDQIARKLEAVNPTKEPLKSDLLNGKWELIYTTSKSILQTQRPKILRSKVNYQAINADTLRAQNMESWPTFNQVTADLTPLNARKVAVKFDYFKIAGLIPIKAPDRARGELEITYLDEELRVSRGDKGNLHATPLKTHGFSFKYPFDSSPSLIASFSPKPNPTSSCIIPSHNNLLGKIILDSLKWRTGVSFLSGFPTKGEDINSLKEELYNTIAPLDRGAEATLQDQERVEEIARKLEALNEIKEPLKSSLLNGKWELIYTTSQSVLQTQRPKFLRPNGKIYQAINADTLRAQNIETWPFFNQVTANLVPLNSRRVAVKFDFFRIASLCDCSAPIGIKLRLPRYTPEVDHWSLAVKDGKVLEKEWRSEIPIPRGGPHSPVRRATLNSRPFSVTASTLKEGHSETPSAPPTSISLGHLTRPDFPILHQEVNGSRLVYLDNGATSQKPTAVLKALQTYYECHNSNVHRGIHYLSAKATEEYELARKKVSNFINASDSREIVFTRNATEAINLVAYSWGLQNIKPNDEIILTVAEHHSAIVPWQFVAQKTGAVLKYVELNEHEVPDVDKLKDMLSRKTKLVVVHHVSNVLGSVLPIKDIVLCAHDVGAKVLVDACQSVPHMVVDVQNLNADFLVASSHKMCGPTGVGFLYGKSDILSAMPPFLGGGEMISDVFYDHSTYQEPPSRLVNSPTY
ncbi:unnamed protein product [Malus baccata var. baccata]